MVDMTKRDFVGYRTPDGRFLCRNCVDFIAAAASRNPWPRVKETFEPCDSCKKKPTALKDD